MTALALNPYQLQAVEFGSGPLLVLAGAGAGKTRVLTQRVAHLIERQGVSPSRILVVTFTNKAAKEMKSRLIQLIGEARVKKIWVGTFHSVCVRLLRQEIERLHYSRYFVIYDPQDQEKLMKEVLAQLELDPQNWRPRKVLSQISSLKNQGLFPAAYRRQALEFEEMTLAAIYERYQEQLGRHNALDFDDLLLLSLQLLQKFPDLLQRYQQHFQHVLVDEYQDTNGVQFELLRLLAAPQQNIFVVGDVDQSIYSFRNADFQIILRFQQDYQGAEVIKLEQNYRSTQPILAAANTLINHNRDRFDKTLISVRGEGQALNLYEAANEYQEADFVLSKIRALQSSGSRDYGDICVLYRTNAQSRLFEERLVQSNVPHQILGAFRFYERKEIKDLMAYLSVLYNPLDALSLKRILNTPKRGIGAKTQQTLERSAEREGLHLWDALNTPTFLQALPAKARQTLERFVSWLKPLQSFQGGLAELVKTLYLESGYQAELAKDPDSFEDRQAYVEQFIQAAQDFQPEAEGPVLGDFLQHLALLSDVDNLQESGRLVRLMTIHAAKGLEFPVVFITGLEEGIFPHQRSIMAEDQGEDAPIEEERRLMYVAMTRAEDQLFLSWARKRSRHGESHYQSASRFLEEIEDHLPGTLAAEQDWQLAPAEADDTWESESVEWEHEPVETLEVDEQVFHPDFGVGRVEKIYSSGAREIAIVNFAQGFGKRILDLKTAPLERL